MQKTLPWTKERIEIATRMWSEENKSASKIAEVLGGTTRHAVRNKLMSLGLSKKNSVVNLLDLKKNHCRFPLWDHQEHATGKFCGRPIKDDESSYCNEHHILTHTKPRKELQVNTLARIDNNSVLKP